ASSNCRQLEPRRRCPEATGDPRHAPGSNASCLRPHAARGTSRCQAVARSEQEDGQGPCPGSGRTPPRSARDSCGSRTGSPGLDPGHSRRSALRRRGFSRLLILRVLLDHNLQQVDLRTTLAVAQRLAELSRLLRVTHQNLDQLEELVEDGVLVDVLVVIVSLLGLRLLLVRLQCGALFLVQADHVAEFDTSDLGPTELLIGGGADVIQGEAAFSHLYGLSMFRGLCGLVRTVERRSRRNLRRVRGKPGPWGSASPGARQSCGVVAQDYRISSGRLPCR